MLRPTSAPILLFAADGAGSGIPGDDGRLGPGASGIPGIPGGTAGGATPALPGTGAASQPDGSHLPPLFSRPQPPVGPGNIEDLELSGWWRRAAATTLDGFLVGIVLLVLVVGPALIFQLFAIEARQLVVRDGVATAAIVVFALWALLLGLASAAYAPVMMARTGGSTLGKLAMDIRVVRENGEAVTLGWAAWREIVIKGMLLGAIGQVTYGLASIGDALWALRDEHHRTWHDLFAKSRVVRR